MYQLFKVGTNRDTKREYWISLKEFNSNENLGLVFKRLALDGCIYRDYTIVILYKNNFVHVRHPDTNLHETINENVLRSDIMNDLMAYININKETYLGLKASNSINDMEYMRLEDSEFVDDINKLVNSYIKSYIK